MNKSLIFSLIAFILSCLSCKKDNTGFPSYLKGIVKFKQYEMISGPQPLLYADGEIRFIVDMKLGTSAKNIDIELDYYLLDGTKKIGDGKVRVNILLDAGLGIYWGSDENYIPIDQISMQGKTITVFLDPEHKYTSSRYTSDTYVNLYKKASITIP